MHGILRCHVAAMILALTVTLAQAQTANVSDISTIKPVMGIPAYRDGRLTDQTMTLINKRLKVEDGRELHKWISGLCKAAGANLPATVKFEGKDLLSALLLPIEIESDFRNPPADAAVFVLAKMSILFTDEKLDPSVSARLLRRLESLDEKTINLWQAALQKATDAKVNRLFTVGVLLPVDQLYTNNTYSPEKAEKYLSRLKQVPSRSVKHWQQNLDQFGGSVVDAAMNIARLDVFFPSEQFNDEAFAKSTVKTNITAPASTTTPAIQADTTPPGPRSTSSQQKPTTLLVRVPADAQLELEGVRTNEKGEVRRFRIPELQFGREFSYRLKASWKEDGSERTVDRKVPLRAGEPAEIDLRRPTGWPRHNGELAGSQEVRVKNPNSFKVTVGLRSDGRGKDFTISDNSMNSVFVPNGKYEIYFQYSTDHDGLYQGDSFTLSNNGVEIQIVKVVNGNYGIKKVN